MQNVIIFKDGAFGCLVVEFAFSEPKNVLERLSYLENQFGINWYLFQSGVLSCPQYPDPGLRRFVHFCPFNLTGTFRCQILAGKPSLKQSPQDLIFKSCWKLLSSSYLWSNKKCNWNIPDWKKSLIRMKWLSIHKAYKISREVSEAARSSIRSLQNFFKRLFPWSAALSEHCNHAIIVIL